MCSGVTFKALCFFYAVCNMYMSITAIVNAKRASQMIGFDNCTETDEGADLADGGIPEQTCNQNTYVFMVVVGVLNCFMSFMLVPAVILRKPVLLKLYMVHMCCHMFYCLYCWLAVLLVFHNSDTSTTLLSFWGIVLILASVYFAMQVWIVLGAYGAIRKERVTVTRQDVPDSSRTTGNILLSMGGFTS